MSTKKDNGTSASIYNQDLLYTLFVFNVANIFDS